MVDLLLEARASTKMVTHDTQTSCLHMAAKNNAVNHARLNSKGLLYLLIPVLSYFRLLSIVRACRCYYYYYFICLDLCTDCCFDTLLCGSVFVRSEQAGKEDETWARGDRVLVSCMPLV